MANIIMPMTFVPSQTTNDPMFFSAILRMASNTETVVIWECSFRDGGNTSYLCL